MSIYSSSISSNLISLNSTDCVGTSRLKFSRLAWFPFLLPLPLLSLALALLRFLEDHENALQNIHDHQFTLTLRKTS